MIFKIFNNIAETTEYTSMDIFDKLLKESIDFWKFGSGAFSIELINTSLVFFKVNQGVYIQHLPSATSPLIRQEKSENVMHYVGGEPMEVPDNCLCDEQIAFQIIKYFIETKGDKHPDFEWVDIFDYL